MRVFRAIVEALVLAVLYFRHDLAPGGSVGAEFVGDHALGRTTLLAQKPLQQPFGGPRIAADLDDCEVAWNRDPAFGVICIQSGPRS